MATAQNNYDFLEPAETPDELGRLGHYRVIRELGRGGMGFVFQAEDVKLKRSVALKVMNQKIAATVGSRQRFISEARAMAAIRHDNVATIFEVGQRNDTPFMAMEMLAGGTLEEKNRNRQPMEFGEVIRYARQIAEGLAAAHERGIVHRDIKPANLWIEEGIDRIKILDFGLALASSPTDTLAGRGSVIGTPGYLSPEQARTEPLDDRSDLYSLGAVLYEMCTGKLPISSKSVHEQLIAILTQKPKPVSERNPEIPQPLSDLIARLLKKEPRARVNSAKELITQLDEAAEACERSTDVAQTIDRLKSGLTTVLDSKAPVVADSMPVSNPFGTMDSSGMLEAIPDPLAANPLSGAPLAGNSGVLPAVPANSTGSIPVAGKPGAVAGKSPAISAGDSSRMKDYLPIAIILLLAVLALPLMTFAFTGFGGSRENIVFVPGGSTVPAPVANRQRTPGHQPKQTQAGNQKPATDKNALANPAAAGKASRGSGTKKNEGGITRTQETTDDRTTAASNLGGSNNAAEMNPKTGSVQTLKPEMPEASGTVSSVTEPKIDEPNLPASDPSQMRDDGGEMASPSDTENKSAITRPSRWVQISTADGGADAMVQSGTTEKYGTSNSIGVRTRNGVETNHSYLAFKLKGAGAPRKQIAEAKLVVSILGRRFPVGGKIRLYGINKKIKWPENELIWKRSFSVEGLDRFPKLAETTLLAENEKDRWASFGADELTEFVKEHDFDYLTFVLAGENGDMMIRMISKEKNPDRAPKLGLRVYENP